MNLASMPPTVSVINSSRRIDVYRNEEISDRIAAWEMFLGNVDEMPLSLHPAWLQVMKTGLGHSIYCLEATEKDTMRGILPLALVDTWMFGRYLVSLPYLNYGGPIASDDDTARLLVDRAVQLADELQVKHLELRTTTPIRHPKLAHSLKTKVQMRLPLPSNVDGLWQQLDAKVRNQVPKAQKSDLHVKWGGLELLSEFYTVFARNMRDLGTPVYGRRLFAAVLRRFSDTAELCVVRLRMQPAAAALVIHGRQVTEVPSASSVRTLNYTGVNMLMYWHLISRAVERKQRVFDFGRSTDGSGTYRFKKQWGAEACPAEWQYYLRHGSIQDLRPDNPRYQSMIRLWQRMPVFLTRWIGPRLVRGIP